MAFRCSENLVISYFNSMYCLSLRFPVSTPSTRFSFWFENADRYVLILIGTGWHSTKELSILQPLQNWEYRLWIVAFFYKLSKNEHQQTLCQTFFRKNGEFPREIWQGTDGGRRSKGFYCCASTSTCGQQGSRPDHGVSHHFLFYFLIIFFVIWIWTK